MASVVWVINTGSSSIKASILELPSLRSVASVQASGLDTPQAKLRVHASNQPEEELPCPADFVAAVDRVLETLRRLGSGEVAAIGHRLVHGGKQFSTPVELTPMRRQQLQALIPLAPLHLPQGLQAIERCANLLGGVRQVACFDTAFHAGRERIYELLPLPREFHARGLRRYGFHGLSYESIVEQLRESNSPLAGGRVVVAHLGNGASLCAIRAGRSVETTMGFSPLDGIPMGSRTGAIDPGVILHLLVEERMPPEELQELLLHRSGLRGVSGISGDVRTLLGSPSPEAAEALELFATRAAMAIASLVVPLGGVDGLVFTGGIGEHAPAVRASIVDRLQFLGVRLDVEANEAGKQVISAASSAVPILVLPAQEELMVARHTRALIEG